MRWKIWVPLGIVLVIVTGALIYVAIVKVYCTPSPIDHAAIPAPTVPSAVAAGHAVRIPSPSDWVDYGPVLEAGPEGAWDFHWAGTTPVGMVKKNGTYYFYYVASDGYRSHDGGPRHRAIGVATSQDGIHFTKYSGNPIMTHSPRHGEEEGANSAGITLDSDGNFVMYYGAAIGPGSKIAADGRVAISSDGLHFTDRAMVLNHLDPCLYGFGDEIFPVAALQHQGNWYVYYQPNGATGSRTLGMAWGPALDHLPYSAKVLDASSGGKPVGTWGNVSWLAPDQIAFFIQRLWHPHTFIEVRTASPDAPGQLSAPVERYDIPSLKRGTVFLDTERNTWFMYYNDFDRFWDVKLAPAAASDTTPPSAPTHLAATAVSHDVVELAWEGPTDPDTGIVQFNVYRNGDKIGSTKDRVFRDERLSELHNYTYAVSAVNFHGAEGPTTQQMIKTPEDTTPPQIISATSHIDPTQVMVTFSEPVDEKSATHAANYSIHPNIEVSHASLGTDRRRLILTTSAHVDALSYTLRIENVRDRANTPNTIAVDTQITYTYSATAGLVGYWNLDQGTGTVASDVSGYANDGWINQAAWRDGLIKGALYFDGDNDYVLVEHKSALAHVTRGSFTFAAWAKPNTEPPRHKGYAILLRVADHPAYFFGLSYAPNQTYQAQWMSTTSEPLLTLSSDRMKPGAWHHTVMVVDAHTQQLSFYVDGKAVRGSPVAYSGTPPDLMGGVYYIGSTKPDLGAGSFFTGHFHGLIDDVRMYNQALTATDVRNLFDLR